MIAVDTNILVYAHREDSHFHTAADQKLAQLAEGDQLWAIPWPCLHEFLAVVTHPRVYDPPTPLPDVLLQVECWLQAPRLQIIAEVGDYWPLLKELITKGRIVGPTIHDARIVAICQANGVKTLWTVDRDFGRISGLEIVNPLL